MGRVQPLWSFWRWQGAEDRLRQLWSDGLSASQIAARLTAEYDDEISRNAVISKAHRLCLPGRPSPIKGYVPGARRPRRGRYHLPVTILPEYARPRPTLSPYSPRSAPAVDASLPPSVPAVTAREGSRLPRAEAAPLPVPVVANPGGQEGGGRPCQWIHDRDVPKWPGKPTFCHHKAVTGESWCEFHRRIAFIPKAERKVDKGRLRAAAE